MVMQYVFSPLIGPAVCVSEALFRALKTSFVNLIIIIIIIIIIIPSVQEGFQ
jgi:hypothetical protein